MKSTPNAVRWVIFVALLVNALIACQSAARSEEPTNYKKLIDGLSNRNTEPMLFEGAQPMSAYFGTEYDWEEQSRVVSCANRLLADADKAWPLFIEFLEDDRYSLNFRGDGSASNFTIGDICYVMLFETFTCAYMPHIPQRESAYRKLRWPEMIPDKGFDRWCRTQHAAGKPLFEIQIEMCEWAVAEIAKLDEVPDEERRTSIGQIRKRIDELRRVRKPVLLKSIKRRETRSTYSKDAAERMRDKIDKTERRGKAQSK